MVLVWLVFSGRETEPYPETCYGILMDVSMEVRCVNILFWTG